MHEDFRLSEEQLKELNAFAKKRASWLERKTKRKDNYLWRELLQDAITDTWLGDVTWDPAKAPLDLHLKRVIRSRTAMMMKHLTRFPRVAVHAPRVDPELEHEMSSAMEAERAREPGGDLGSILAGVVGTLYMLAATADDADVLRILDCFGTGLVHRRDILRATGMTVGTYHNARRRLMAFVECLPRNRRDEALRARG